jgi:hypothetical protein
MILNNLLLDNTGSVWYTMEKWYVTSVRRTVEASSVWDGEEVVFWGGQTAFLCEPSNLLFVDHLSG